MTTARAFKVEFAANSTAGGQPKAILLGKSGLRGAPDCVEHISRSPIHSGMAKHRLSAKALSGHLGTVPFFRYRWRMGGTEGRERRWCGNLWRLRYVAPTAATDPVCARTNRPHRSRRLSQ